MRLVPLALLLALIGCNRAADPTPVSGSAAGAGWDVRYNAVLALARRSSPKLNDMVVQELFKEMLDEEQQMRNFRTKLKDGREVSDTVAARTAVLGAVKALEEYKIKNASADLSMYRPALEKLQASPNAMLKQESQRLLDKIK